MTDATTRVRLPPAVRETVEAFLAGLRERFGPRLTEVRLFGSYARGEAHEESDVDCLVLIEDLSPDDSRAVTDLTGDLTWQIGGVVISPLVMSPGRLHRMDGARASNGARDRAPGDSALSRRARQRSAGIPTLMTGENKRANITAELRRCQESLRLAEVLLDAGLLPGTEPPGDAGA